MKQHTADGALLGPSTWSLVPPGSEDFSVYGTPEVVGRAREWANRYRYLLYRGPGEQCVHGLYRMDACRFPACTSVRMDHTQIWVRHDSRSAFILTQPYCEEIPGPLRTYADMHGLRIESHSYDGWYSDRTLPIRLTIPNDWPLWPIERDAALLLHTQPVTWPDED